jgi:hypothetical protein
VTIEHYVHWVQRCQKAVLGLAHIHFYFVTVCPFD